MVLLHLQQFRSYGYLQDMDINKAFDDLQREADAAPEHVREARRRRDVFCSAFAGEDEVDEVFASGSLARSTQREPINDVDLVIIFDAAEHPEWGPPGSSAGDALAYLGQRVNALLSITNGEFAQEVRLARPGNHAVKCFLDDPDAESPFTVDVMPALRQVDGTLLVPEKANERWILTNPEFLIARVAERQAEWSLFRPLVRLLKLWNDDHDTTMKSLTMEVLALEQLRDESSRPRALQRFFTAAEQAIEYPIEDPAGLCGPTQSNLDRDRARTELSVAAKASWEAVVAQDEGETDRAACLWHSVFGDAFPEPPGGCPAEESQARSIGAATATAGAVGGGTTRRRPIRDAPQG
jgi:hypothetical protein